MLETQQEALIVLAHRLASEVERPLDPAKLDEIRRLIAMSLATVDRIHHGLPRLVEPDEDVRGH
jgi:hypothetical protein